MTPAPPDEPDKTVPTPAFSGGGGTPGEPGWASTGTYGSASTPGSPLPPFAPDEPPPPLPTERYRIARFHARGGMGEVWVAEDLLLRRPVAYKCVRPDVALAGALVERFRREATTTARLQHPGIIPVYDCGTAPDGRPFLTMRFVAGDTLGHAAARYHYAGPGEPPEARALAFRGLLMRFLTVCQAVGFAHEQGVVHRDLKPANVLLGGFGETVVLDWGISRDHSDPDLAGLTLDGSLLGTPGYMSPEQADGRSDEVGPAADVFGLGAVLFELLAGHRPYPGENVLAVLRKASNRAIEFPPVTWPGVPAELKAIALKAMAAAPTDRHASPVALAAALEHWLADEEEKRVAVVAERFAAGQRQLALRALTRLVNDIHRRMKAAPALQDLRKGLLASALEGLQELCAATDAVAAADHTRVQAHLELGDIYRDLEAGGTTQADVQYRKAAEIAATRAAADPADARARRDLAVSRERLGDVRLRAGDGPAAREHYACALGAYQQLAEENPADVQAETDLAVGLHKAGEAHLCLGEIAAAVECHRRALDAQLRLAAAAPADPAAGADVVVGLNKLGDALLRAGDLAGAAEHYEAAFRRCEARAAGGDADARRDLGVGHERLGDIALRLGDRPAARAAFAAVLAITREAAREDETSARAQRDLSVACERLARVLLADGDGNGAAEVAAEATAICQRLAAADPDGVPTQRDLLANLALRGEVEQTRGDFAAAAEWYEQAIEVAEQPAYAAALEADGGLVRRRLAVCHFARRAAGVAGAFAGVPPAARVPVLRAVMEVHLCRRRFADAARLASDLAGSTDSPVDRFEAACALARAAAHDPARADEWAAAAAAVIHGLEGAGYPSAEQLRRDTDLEPLRTRGLLLPAGGNP